MATRRQVKDGEATIAEKDVEAAGGSFLTVLQHQRADAAIIRSSIAGQVIEPRERLKHVPVKNALYIYDAKDSTHMNQTASDGGKVVRINAEALSAERRFAPSTGGKERNVQVRSSRMRSALREPGAVLISYTLEAMRAFIQPCFRTAHYDRPDKQAIAISFACLIPRPQADLIA